MAERRRFRRLIQKPDRMAIQYSSSSSDEERENPSKRRSSTVPDDNHGVRGDESGKEEEDDAGNDEALGPNNNQEATPREDETTQSGDDSGNDGALGPNNNQGSCSNPQEDETTQSGDDTGNDGALGPNNNQEANPLEDETTQSGNESEAKGEGRGEDDANEEEDKEEEGGSEDEVNEEEDEEEEGGSEDEVNEEEDDEEEEEEGGQEEEDEKNKPLYRDAPVTVHQTMLSIMTLVITHSLTGVCLADILKLISLLLPAGNLFKSTLYKFKKYFSIIGNHVMILHYFCSGCMYPLDTKDTVCQFCGGASPVSYFIELPIIVQLQRMLMRPGFYEKLQYRFNRVKRHKDHIEDIYDGNIYKGLFQPGQFLHNPNNVSFMWYSDGVSIFRGSSNFSIWPLFLVINELNYKNRVSRENMILAGLWFGAKKPNVNLFLLPFRSFFQQFSSNGHDFSLPNDKKIKVKGMLLCGTCDYQAKTSFMKFVAHNGFYGCAHCLTRGVGQETPGGPHKKGRVQVYPYQQNIRLRKHDEVLECAQRAEEAGKPCLGVHGLSALYHMVPDFVKCMAQDVMHGTYLGIFKLLMTLWFSTSQAAYSLHNVVHIVDARLKQIHPPSFVQRLPRSIGQHLKHWKASEYKLFMMYYSVPVLHGILDEQYYQHYVKLVSGVFLLGQDSIPFQDVERARSLLHSFVSDFQRLYGIRYLVLNVHQILHLPDTVLELGPTWVYACFFLEGMNAYLLKMFHGTRHVGLQICTAASTFITLPVLIRSLDVSPLKQFCEYLVSDVKNVKINERIPPLDSNSFSVGKYTKLRDLPPRVSQAMAIAKLKDGNWLQFHRFKKRGIMYCAETYTRVKTRYSSLVLLSINNVSKFCKVNYFFKRTSCQCTVVCECAGEFYGIGSLYRPKNWAAVNVIENVRMPYFLNAECLNEMVAFPIQSIRCLCFYMRVDNDDFIAKPLNSLEIE